MLPAWTVPNVKYTIPVTIGQGIAVPKGSSPDLNVTGARLAWSAITSGRPPALFPSIMTLAGRDYRRWRIWASLGMLEPDGSGGLRRTTEFDALDPTEKGHLNYALAGAVAKAYTADKLGSPWLAHLSLALKANYAATFDKSVRRRPDYFGLSQAGDFLVAEAKGRMVLREELKKSLNKKDQTKAIATINGITPVARYGFATTATSAGVGLFATDPEDRIDIRISRSIWLSRYYRMVVDVADAIDSMEPAAERALLGAEHQGWIPYRLRVPTMLRGWARYEGQHEAAPSEGRDLWEERGAAATLSGLEVGSNELNPDYTWFEPVDEDRPRQG